jgi:hypothetical protein
MNCPALTSMADEINRLHAEVVCQTHNSKKCLHAALGAAWRAGQLLLTEKKRVRDSMGAAWGQWLTEKFKGTHRTAQNYMRLAESVADVSAFDGLSLRQVYLRLGIATEPKSRTDSPRVEQLPAHVRLANRLLLTLSASSRGDREQSAAFRQDLRALYERLCRLFEPGVTANFSATMLSNHNDHEPTNHR